MFQNYDLDALSLWYDCVLTHSILLFFSLLQLSKDRDSGLIYNQLTNTINADLKIRIQMGISHFSLYFHIQNSKKNEPDSTQCINLGNFNLKILLDFDKNLLNLVHWCCLNDGLQVFSSTVVPGNRYGYPMLLQLYNQLYRTATWRENSCPKTCIEFVLILLFPQKMHPKNLESDHWSLRKEMCAQSPTSTQPLRSLPAELNPRLAYWWVSGEAWF